MTVKKGDKVKVQYEGKLEDGTVFDSSEKHGQALEFEAGSGQVIKGFDDAVMGMNEGEEKEVNIDAKDAYGEPNPEMVQKVPKEKMPQGQEIKPGMVLALQAPDGRQFPVKVQEVTGSEVTIDMNHPLAGKKLKFKVKMEKIN